MKKAFFAVAGVLLSVGLLFANGAKDPTSGKASGVKDSDLVNGRFKTTRHIVVEVFDRSNDGGSNPEDNFYANFIKEGMLRDHNVAVTFKRVPRWTEVEALNNLLAASDAPDVCLTYSYPTVQTYGDMGGVLDMAPYLAEYKADLPNLYKLLGDLNMYNNRDPKSGRIWAIESMFFQNNRISTFVREDWLKKLNLKEPKTLSEFEAMLKAFKANASTLLGSNADKMIPFSMTIDVGWRAGLLLDSFVPDKITEKEMWEYGFDDRHLTWPGIKEGVRVLNKWYNQGLVWKDFPIYPYGDKTEENLVKAGYVGAVIGNWDWPYRDGENGIHGMLQKTIGPDAAFIAVDCFKNNAGKYRKYLSSTTSDRKIFFPSTNDEPVASLLYLDWISKLENRKFLQIGEAGVTHQVQADGSVKTIAAKGEKIMNSDKNIDYTMTINGLDLGDSTLNVKSLANGYAGVDKRFIEKSYAIQRLDSRVGKNFNVGKVEAENGMGPALTDKQRNLFTQSVVAKTEQFDAVFDSAFKDYLSSGGQAIIDERKAKYASMIETKK